MKTITLTDEQAQTLINELYEYQGYSWNDDCKHADDCPSKVLSIIQDQIDSQKYAEASNEDPYPY